MRTVFHRTEKKSVLLSLLKAFRHSRDFYYIISFADFQQRSIRRYCFQIYPQVLFSNYHKNNLCSQDRYLIKNLQQSVSVPCIIVVICKN